MPRIKDTLSKRDNKNRILPKGITQRKDGRYMFRFTYQGEVTKPIYDWDLTRIKKTAEEIRARVTMGTYNIHSAMTLNQWFVYYMEYRKETGLREISARGMQDYYKWYIRDTPVGKTQLCKLTKLQMVKHFKQLQEREEHPLSIGTVRRVCGIVENALDEAVVQGIIPINVTCKLGRDIPEIVKQQKREAIPQEEVARLLCYIKKHKFFYVYYNMFVVMFGLGLRVGEMCALTDEDVLEDHLLVYKTLNYRTLKDTDGKERRCRFISDTKTFSGIRSLPYPDEVKKAIESQRALNEKNPHKCQETIPVMYVKSDGVELQETYSNFFFYGNDGTAYTPEYVAIIIKRIRDAFDRDEKRLAEKEQREVKPLMKFSPHYMRHTFATRASEAGLESSHVSKWMGHSLREESHATKVYVHKNWKDGYKELEVDLEKLNKVKIMVE